MDKTLDSIYQKNRERGKFPILCHETTIPGQYPVSLTQQGVDSFTVRYGRQEKSDLTYGAAAREYGSCIMHALACNDQLDNREAS